LGSPEIKGVGGEGKKERPCEGGNGGKFPWKIKEKKEQTTTEKRRRGRWN